MHGIPPVNVYRISCSSFIQAFSILGLNCSSVLLIYGLTISIQAPRFVYSCHEDISNIIGAMINDLYLVFSPHRSVAINLSYSLDPIITLTSGPSIKAFIDPVQCRPMCPSLLCELNQISLLAEGFLNTTRRPIPKPFSVCIFIGDVPTHVFQANANAVHASIPSTSLSLCFTVLKNIMENVFH